MSDTKKVRSYECWLPVYKQGDDFHDHLVRNPGDPAAAFLGLAERYEDAARQCRRVASVLKESPEDVTVDGCTHFISIQAPESTMAGLLADEVVGVCAFGEDEDEDEDDDNDGDDDGDP
jgi:hypothetical protein